MIGIDAVFEKGQKPVINITVEFAESAGAWSDPASRAV